MLKFRNPGTNFVLHIQIIKGLYKQFGMQIPFTLDEMANVIAVQENLMTAYGYSRESAIQLSNREDKSRDSAYNNAKMYAEHFRILGLITPYKDDKSYPLIITYIGAHIAMADQNALQLYEQCIWGINNPTELTDRVKYTENSRFLKCVLNTLVDLGGTMYKHELCMGPMSINDTNNTEYSHMLQFINSIRGDDLSLCDAFKNFAESLKMSTVSVDNQTRMPVAFLSKFKYVESIRNYSLYNKNKQCLKITEYGIKVLNHLNTMKDMRLNEFNSYEKSIQLALIRLGIYSMLKRSGYDLSTVECIIKQDNKLCTEILNGKDLLFSPYQTIKRSLVEEALGINISNDMISKENINTFTNNSSIEKVNKINTLDLNIPTYINEKILNTKEDIEFLTEVEKLKNKGLQTSGIVDSLFEKYKTATKDNFYPLISTIFKIINFNCEYSRPGDNGARWDAIIIDSRRSIPIEIKSPTEEMHLSVKAIRQALENKIILLSRKTHITDKNTTSLAIGYCLPNDRAEVSKLISDVKETYGYKIGVLDFKSLLNITISILIDNKGFNKEKLYELEGLASANI